MSCYEFKFWVFVALLTSWTSSGKLKITQFMHSNKQFVVGFQKQSLKCHFKTVANNSVVSPKMLPLGSDQQWFFVCFEVFVWRAPRWVLHGSPWRLQRRRLDSFQPLGFGDGSRGKIDRRDFLITSTWYIIEKTDIPPYSLYDIAI